MMKSSIKENSPRSLWTILSFKLLNILKKVIVEMTFFMFAPCLFNNNIDVLSLTRIHQSYIKKQYRPKRFHSKNKQQAE